MPSGTAMQAQGGRRCNRRGSTFWDGDGGAGGPRLWGDDGGSGGPGPPPYRRCRRRGVTATAIQTMQTQGCHDAGPGAAMETQRSGVAYRSRGPDDAVAGGPCPGVLVAPCSSACNSFQEQGVRVPAPPSSPQTRGDQHGRRWSRRDTDPLLLHRRPRARPPCSSITGPPAPTSPSQRERPPCDCISAPELESRPPWVCIACMAESVVPLDLHHRPRGAAPLRLHHRHSARDPCSCIAGPPVPASPPRRTRPPLSLHRRPSACIATPLCLHRLYDGGRGPPAPPSTPQRHGPPTPPSPPQSRGSPASPSPPQCAGPLRLHRQPPCSCIAIPEDAVPLRLHRRPSTCIDCMAECGPPAPPSPPQSRGPPESASPSQGAAPLRLHHQAPCTCIAPQRARTPSACISYMAESVAPLRFHHRLETRFPFASIDTPGRGPPAPASSAPLCVHRRPEGAAPLRLHRRPCDCITAPLHLHRLYGGGRGPPAPASPPQRPGLLPLYHRPRTRSPYACIAGPPVPALYPRGSGLPAPPSPPLRLHRDPSAPASHAWWRTRSLCVSIASPEAQSP